MRFATLIVEQLDRAATELAVNHPLNSRIALILVDNAAELIIQRRCEDLVRTDRRQSKPKLTAAERREILGHFFGKKTRFLEKMAAISGGECHFINELHGHRNTLYHAGLSNDDIIRPLAIAYYRLTCALLARFDNKSIGWPKDLVIAQALHVYFPDAAAGRSFPGFDAARVSKQLLKRTPQDAPALEAALGRHSEAFVAQMNAQFDSIKLGLDRKSTPGETFRQLQRAWDFQKLVRDRMKKNNREDEFILFGHPVLNQFAAKLMPKWKPRYASPPFERWRARAKTIAAEHEPLAAIRKFTNLRQDMEYLADAIGDAHEYFWGWVQQQEDAAMDARSC